METKLASAQIVISKTQGRDASCSHNFAVLKTSVCLLCLFVASQQSLLRQQERVEERVQEIEEQLCKLDSDKCVVEVCFDTLICGHTIA